MTSIIAFLKKNFSRMIFIIEEGAKKSEDRMIPFGLFGVLVPFFYYVINLYILPTEPYESFAPRISMVVFCLFLILKDHWPKKLKPFLPIYWYITLLYSMPFIITFMALKNNFASAWMMNLLSVLILMMLLVDWISYTIILGLGILIAWVLYYFTASEPYFYSPGVLTYRNLIDTFVISIIMGIVFSRKKEKVEQEKLQTMKLLSANIAHELRTPLAAINAGAGGLQEYLPDLISSHELARKYNVPVPKFSPSQLRLMKKSLENIRQEIHSANTIINMLLLNFDQSRVQSTTLKLCSINQVIEEALRRYPFLPDEKNLVHWKKNGDFTFYGEELFTVHIIFNLLKNALYYVKAARKGNIQIWTELGTRCNLLHFRDTGKGIPVHILPNIFERFFSRTYHGFGVGLAFCQMVMQTYGGEITCQSEEGEYTEFTLSFPTIHYFRHQEMEKNPTDKPA